MSQEESQRSEMVVAMERTFNPAWFSMRTKTHLQHCKLSTGQYWDWLTYIDVSSKEA